jgi:hypothetical protein
MTNSKEARKTNRALRDMHPEGVLESIYERQEKNSSKKPAQDAIIIEAAKSEQN